MRILVEEYQYDATLVRDVLQGIDALQNVEGLVSLSYVGYFYNTKLKDCVFILPKVLMDERSRVFSKYSPCEIIHMDKSKLTDEERMFLYEFAVWIYRAVDVFHHTHKDTDIVYHRRISQVGRGMRKRTNTLLDILLSLIMLVFLIVPIIVISIMVKATSKGPVMFRQERVTTYGRKFKILKFRTMVVNAESLGTQVTTDHDDRVTKIGRKLRKYRLDELPQIFNVLSGSMSFVGVRPEVPKYVEQYEDVYYATLLMPAGITSPASIQYKDEEKLLAECDDADKVYIEQILPEKMKYNLSYIENFGFFSDIGIMFKTVVEVAK